MRKYLVLLIIGIFTFSSVDSDAQLWKRLKEKAQKRVEKNLEEKMEEEIDETMDETIDGDKSEKETKKENVNNRQKINSDDITELIFNVYPPDGAVDIDTEVEFTWESNRPDDMGFKGFEVYLSDNLDNLNEGLVRAPKKPKFLKKDLQPNTTYYWKVITRGEKISYPGNVFSFTTKSINTLNWAKYDFVSGDEIIFEDGPSKDEENGEFPSRWDLESGQVEIANFNGENVIMFIDGTPTIIPYMKNADQDYLPDVFTIEFDIYKPASSNRIFMNLYDVKNQKNEDNIETTIGYNYIDMDDYHGEYPKEIDREKGRWIHIAVAYTKGKLKMYMDDTRLINIPHYEGNPTGFSINCYFADAEHLYYLKNFRISKGGVKYYDRVMNEGKIIVHGIKFDVGKATLRPESIGSINEIFDVMTKNPEINFSVEGHTDSDGDEQLNLKLSEERALTVMNQLIAMGIDQSRLKYKGLGESTPMSENSTSEGKAQNRRVEFVKF